jgi:protein gp37
MLPLEGIDWVILGGMSGPKWQRHRLEPGWARSVRDQCQAAGVAFFFKQWGGP